MGTGTINSKKRYLNNLTTKHRMLDKEINVLYNNHSSDDIVKAKKQEKLQLKEAIVAMENELNQISKH
jgi:hypothetical protein